MTSFDYAQSAFNSREQIRILTLLPATPPSSDESGEKLGLIHTSLEAVNWADKPPYIALSYMWGDQTLPETILVNERTFAIGANLHQALRQLQTENPICLWVDAICINQNDDLEKGEQVANMTEIYKAAASVFA
jgi:Heterokaryon incompatibility protein (HET)